MKQLVRKSTNSDERMQKDRAIVCALVTIECAVAGLLRDAIGRAIRESNSRSGPNDSPDAPGLSLEEHRQVAELFLDLQTAIANLALEHHMKRTASSRSGRTTKEVAEARGQRLQRFLQRQRIAGRPITIRLIGKAANVPEKGHRSLAYWRRGKLDDSAAASIRIENVLAGKSSAHPVDSTHLLAA